MAVPAISIILPVYNAGRYLAKAIDSILFQTFDDFELIVVNDGSSDSSLDQIRKAAARDVRVHFISRQRRGLVQSLNDAIAAAQGFYIARMDADDICFPNRIERQHAFLSANPGCVAVGSTVDLIDARGWRLKSLSPPCDHATIVEQLLEGNGGAIIHPTVMAPAPAIREVGGYAERFSGYGEDWDLFMRLSEVGTLHNLSVPLLKYRIHAKSYNHTRSQLQISTLLAAVNRARTFYHLGCIDQLPSMRDLSTEGRFHEQCVCWALEGDETTAAMVHAAMMLSSTPGKRSLGLAYYLIRRLINQRRHEKS